MNIGIRNLSANRFVIAAAAIFLFSFAEGSSAQTAQQDSSPIKRIAIDSEIAQPEIPLIQGPDDSKAFLIGGGIGVALNQEEAGKAFREYMRKNNIDVSRIVFESFKRIIQEDRIFDLADKSDTKLKLVINTYGFGHSGFFAGKDRRPLMNITASLVANGSEVWKKTDYITNLSKLTDIYTYDQLGENPQLTVKSLEQVSGMLSRQILSDFKQ
jgi:hypothetical protein